MHYCFIARDSDMIVFEKLINKQLNQRQLTNEAVQLVSKMEGTPEGSRVRFQKVSMEGMAASASVECHVLYDVVFIGLVTSTGYGEEAARRFLEQMHEAITRHYAENLVFIKRQQNLKPNVFDKKFSSDFRKIYNNNDTGIKMGTISEAQNQVDEIKEIAQRATGKQLNNLAEGERLLKTTQQMNELA